MLRRVRAGLVRRRDLQPDPGPAGTGPHRARVPFPVFLVFTEIKVRIEERLMQAEFPDEYPRYRQRVPKRVPGLRLPGRRTVASG